MVKMSSRAAAEARAADILAIANTPLFIIARLRESVEVAAYSSDIDVDSLEQAIGKSLSTASERNLRSVAPLYLNVVSLSMKGRNDLFVELKNDDRVIKFIWLPAILEYLSQLPGNTSTTVSVTAPPLDLLQSRTSFKANVSYNLIDLK